MNLLDNLGKRVADTYKTAAKASSDILEETKLRISIINDQNKMEELYEKLGEKVFSLYEKGESLGEDFDTECSEIQSIKQNVTSMKTKIKELRHLKICPQCQLEIELMYQFCPSCGIKQEMPIETESPLIICQQCKNELSEEYEFCPQCGAKKE